DHGKEHDRGTGRAVRRPDADDRGDEPDKYQPEQEHGRGHPHRESPVGRIPGTRRHDDTSVRPRLVSRPGPAANYLAQIYPSNAERQPNVTREYAQGLLPSA